MLNSMTGYGQAEECIDGVTYSVEIKTVNNRYFRARIKLPENMLFLEDEVEKYLQKELFRGSVNYTLRMKNVPAENLFEIDGAVLKSYIEQLGEIAGSVDLECPINISQLLSLPGVILPVTPDDAQIEVLRKNVLGVTARATAKLKEMRAVEGAALGKELESYCDAMKTEIDKIKVRGPVVLQEYGDKLKKRSEELLGDSGIKIDDETLGREVAIYAERSDISEEIARLDSHLSQFSQSCRTNEQAGRKLDFICQEMLREANTIASKSGDVEIAHCVVNIKCWIDRLKEQIQNIE